MTLPFVRHINLNLPWLVAEQQGHSLIRALCHSTAKRLLTVRHAGPSWDDGPAHSLPIPLLLPTLPSPDTLLAGSDDFIFMISSIKYIIEDLIDSIVRIQCTQIRILLNLLPVQPPGPSSLQPDLLSDSPKSSTDLQILKLSALLLYYLANPARLLP